MLKKKYDPLVICDANGTMAQFEIVDVAVKMVILHMNHHFPMVFPWLVFPWFSHSLQRVLGMGLSEAMDPMVDGGWGST